MGKVWAMGRGRARMIVLVVGVASSVGARALVGQDALVLSTGASRGFAHVGAIMALDSLGYDPDLVVGTSMGAAVGALYASGLTPTEISLLLQLVDWGDVFRPHTLLLGPTRQTHVPALRLGVDLAPFEVSQGFIDDWGVNRLLVRLLFRAQAASRGDFDKLARRFRPVASDLSTGEEIVLAHGDLARAVRISMGAPGFFAPVEWEGRLLTDGGVANYLPISVARDLGASHVVAVDVSRPHPRVRRTDPASIGGRALGLLMRNAVPDTTPDVLIRPDIESGFSGAFFPSDITDLYRMGIVAAAEALPRRQLDRRRQRTLPAAPEMLAALELEVADATLEPMVLRVFRDVAPAPFDAEDLLERVDRLYATGLVDGVWPRVESRSDVVAGGNGETRTTSDTATRDVLVVRVDAVPRRSLAFTPGYENDRGGRIWAQLVERLLLRGTPLEVSLAASTTGLEQWGATSARLYAPGLPLSFVAGAHVRKVETRFQRPDSLPPQRDVRRVGAWISSELRQLVPNRVTSLAMHAEHVAVENGDRGDSWGPSLRIVTAVGSNLVVGVAPEVEAELRFGDVSYASAALRTSRAVPLGSLVVAGVVDVAVTTGSAPLDARPALGDRHAMPGLAWGEGRGLGRALLGVDLAKSVFTAGTLRARLRAGAAPSRARELWETPGSWMAGAALEGLWSMPFGPIMVGVGANTGGDVRLDVSLGPVF